MVDAIALWNCQINTFTMKECHGLKYFCVFSTVIFKQKLLQIVLWKKQAPSKKDKSKIKAYNKNKLYRISNC